MKHKKTLTNLAFILLGMGGIYAQESLGAAGGEATGAGGTSSYTIGQVVYTTAIGSNNSVAQGVQQTYEVSSTAGLEETTIQLDVVTYPNPTSDMINLTIENYNDENLTYQLYNIQGVLMESKQVKNSTTEIVMRDFPSSIYLLKVSENNSMVKTFRIIKN